MATLFNPFMVYVDGNGVPGAGDKLYFYTTGTSTPQDTFSDDDLDPSHVNTNPVTADANGLFPPIYLGTTDYKAILKTAAGVTIATIDPVLVNPQAATLTAQLDSAFGSTQYTILQRGASAWGGITPKAFLDNKFGSTANKYPRRGASDWETVDLCLQVASTLSTASATGTTQMPADNTLPQKTEGDEYMTLAVTPVSATSKLVIEVTALVSCDATDFVSLGLFKDADADAIAATGVAIGTNGLLPLVLRHVVVSASTSARTYKVRIGPNSANTVTFNGVSGTRMYGGAVVSSIVIREYPVLA